MVRVESAHEVYGGTMQRIDRIVRAEAKKDQLVVDTVSLTWEERQKSRQKLWMAHGQEIAAGLRDLMIVPRLHNFSH
jgi:urease accessory protein UreE